MPRSASRVASPRRLPPASGAAASRVERETGIEPATNSLEGCDSTTELLPPSRGPLRCPRFGAAGPPGLATPSTLRGGRPRSARHSVYASARQATFGSPLRLLIRRCHATAATSPHRSLTTPPAASSQRGRSAPGWLAEPKLAAKWRAKAGGEGRIRTSEAARATDLQSAAFDRFATSPFPRPHVSAPRRREDAPQRTADG
jgi:hypothetical protein